jgi:WD40 repeat protein
MVALWDCPSSWTSSTLSSKSKFTSSSEEEEEQQAEEPQRMDPVLSWKAHGGRWIADARFVSGGPSTSSANTSTHSTSTPSRLLTAANDGCVCLWDLTTVSVQTGAPKQLLRCSTSHKKELLHTSGIFAMDVLDHTNTNTANGSSSSSNVGVMVATGSKDKTVAVSTLLADSSLTPVWRSDYHSAKVGAVQLRGSTSTSTTWSGSTILASASDDGTVAIHDYRTSRIVAELTDAHVRPHSVVWDPDREHQFLTGKYDHHNQED